MIIHSNNINITGVVKVSETFVSMTLIVSIVSSAAWGKRVYASPYCARNVRFLRLLSCNQKSCATGCFVKTLPMICLPTQHLKPFVTLLEKP